VKIVSLLPSATEIVFSLGLADSLCGVTFECDHPAEARSYPHVSGTALPNDGTLTAGEIDAAVTARVAAGESIYTLDDALIRRIDPDLILAQDLCRVCAVPSGAVQDALDVIGCHATVLSLDPQRLDDVIGCIGAVGDATGTADLAGSLMADLRGRVEAVRRRTAGLERPRVLVLEWADPPFNAGHWVPDMVAAAGGAPLLAASGQRSRQLGWDEIATEDVDVVVFMPCGFDLAGAVDQAGPLLDRPELAGARRFYAVDGNAYFSRPGPRVVDGVELLEAVLHSTGAPAAPPGATRLR
jgi:iron complex transport system substrate-binding protein